MKKLEDLIVRAQTGDQDAFSTIVQRFQAMALSYAYSVLGDYELAEDARQEAFIAAYCDLYTLRNPLSFPAWFRQIVLHHSIRFKKRRRILTVPMPDGLEPAAAQRHPVETIDERDRLERVKQTIDQLPSREQEAIRLFYLEDLSLKEISRRVGLPVKTILSRLHTGRARLRQRLVEMVKDTVQKQYRSGDRRPRQAASVAAIEMFDDQIKDLIKTPVELREQMAEDQRKAGELICARGRLLRFMGRMAEAQASFQQGLNLSHLRRDPVWRARLKAECGITYLQTADYPAARTELLASRKLAKRLEGDDSKEQNLLQAVVLDGLGVCAWGEGNFSQARKFYLASLGLCRDLSCEELEAEALNNLALLDWKRGRLAEALESFKTGLRLWKRMQNRFGHALTLMNIGIIEEALGRGVLARRHYEESLALAGEINFVQVRAAANCNLANLEIVDGNWAQALEHTRQALELAEGIGDRRSQAIALENLALTHLGMKQPGEAAEALAQARRLARTIGDQERSFSLELVEVEALLEENKTAQALEQALENLGSMHYVLETCGYRAELPRLLRLKCRAHWLAGQVKQARGVLQKARRECRKQNNRAEEKRLEALEREMERELESRTT